MKRERGDTMIIITATYKGERITRIAYGDFQAFTVINLLAREGAADIGMREAGREKSAQGREPGMRTSN